MAMPNPMAMDMAIEYTRVSISLSIIVWPTIPMLWP